MLSVKRGFDIPIKIAFFAKKFTLTIKKCSNKNFCRLL